jgi:hypothetical protein
MNFVFTEGGLRIGRDVTDKRARTETEVVYRAVKSIPGAHRFNPSRYGLTDSKLGLYIGASMRSSKQVYWHANYMVENAQDAFNGGAVFFHKA